MENSQFAFYLDQQIRKIVREEIEKAKFVKSYPAIVDSVDGDLADVKIAGDSNTIITNLKNRTGTTLSPNDTVLLFSPTNNLSNLYIAVKL